VGGGPVGGLFFRPQKIYNYKNIIINQTLILEITEVTRTMMTWRRIAIFAVLAAIVLAGPALAERQHKIACGSQSCYAITKDWKVVGWGHLSEDREFLSDRGNAVSIAEGTDDHLLALTGTNKVKGFGGPNDAGQITIPGSLKSATDITDIAAGRSFSAVIKDGKIQIWGSVPASLRKVPPEIQKAFAISAGDMFILALDHDNHLYSWGEYAENGGSVHKDLSWLEERDDIIDIAARGDHGMALIKGGTVIQFGREMEGVEPIPQIVDEHAIAIAAGKYFNLALLDIDGGKAVAWGDNVEGECNVPEAALSDVVGIAAGDFNALALKRDGSIVAWGSEETGVNAVPREFRPVEPVVTPTEPIEPVVTPEPTHTVPTVVPTATVSSQHPGHEGFTIERPDGSHLNPSTGEIIPAWLWK
jgi:alpha-tubulin suppressor-like RCC1 family protein